MTTDEILELFKNKPNFNILKKSLNIEIYQLFPYSAAKYNDFEALEEIKKSCLNLNTRLLNLKKINKSLSSFIDDSSPLNWQELQNINKELLKE